MEWERERERRDAISRPYLLIMSLYFKVQSVPVMLLRDCASGEFPHRSDDKRTADSRCAWGSYSLTVWHVWNSDKNILRSLLFFPLFVCVFNQHTAADRRTWRKGCVQVPQRDRTHHRGAGVGGGHQVKTPGTFKDTNRGGKYSRWALGGI